MFYPPPVSASIAIPAWGIENSQGLHVFPYMRVNTLLK